eukprot:scaffold162302_cov32-Tisochrysis_lutea.AAC.2
MNAAQRFLPRGALEASTTPLACCSGRVSRRERCAIEPLARVVGSDWDEAIDVSLRQMSCKLARLTAIRPGTLPMPLHSDALSEVALCQGNQVEPSADTLVRPVRRASSESRLASGLRGSSPSPQSAEIASGEPLAVPLDSPCGLLGNDGSDWRGSRGCDCRE